MKCAKATSVEMPRGTKASKGKREPAAPPTKVDVEQELERHVSGHLPAVVRSVERSAVKGRGTELACWLVRMCAHRQQSLCAHTDKFQRSTGRPLRVPPKRLCAHRQTSLCAHAQTMHIYRHFWPARPRRRGRPKRRTPRLRPGVRRHQAKSAEMRKAKSVEMRKYFKTKSVELRTVLKCAKATSVEMRRGKVR